MLKLALGTVQFGLPYGINNKSGVPTDDELDEILSTAKEAGIEILDSAQGYGNAEERLGKLSKNEFQIITKFKNLKSPYPFHTELAESLLKLKSDSLYAYMAHDGNLLIENPSWWEGLQIAKERGLIEKIGYSLYSVDQLETLFANNMIPDIIQFPYNILDRRFESFLPKLATLGVEIHTRSVYLQGLLQMDPNRISSQFSPLQPHLSLIREIALKNELSIAQICLGFAINNIFINKVVIGIDNLFQLKENIRICQKTHLSFPLMNELNSIEVKDTSLLNPTNWKKVI
jgi:aryl-alcohol dehydrogenase-like predicted oxidoreductase